MNALSSKALRRHHARHGAQRGAASLIVVMVLFFVMAMVAAYTNRNLIFEQRTSINQYRSTQAFEAAESGLEWALAQLNGGRIDANCAESGTPTTNTSFRQRYLDINSSTGMIAVLTQPTAGSPPRRAGCVWNGTDWSCRCPSSGNPALPTSTSTDTAPAFWVSFSTNLVTRPGIVQIVVNGCTRVDTACLGSGTAPSDVEGRAQVTSYVALKSSISTSPAAALTVAGDVPVGAAISVYNTAVDRGGITIRANGSVASGLASATIPGSPVASSVIALDTSLNVRVPSDMPAVTTGDRFFTAVFGAWPSAIRYQPGAVRMTCPTTGCRQSLADTVAMNPDRVIWIEGDLTLESAGDIGSMPDPADPTVAGPATIVVNGALKSTAPGVRIFGLVYMRSGNWDGPVEIQGAAISEGGLTNKAAGSVVFNGTVIDSLLLRAGSFVKAPGGWRDFVQ